MAEIVRDKSILEHILNHIADIYKAVEHFTDNVEVFQTNNLYFNTVNMSLLQSGELSNHLSDAFLNKYNDIPWHSIVALRNVVVHGYGTLEKPIIWNIAKNDIPVLEEKCRGILGQEQNEK
jgi:uncharacterized protein with HEPN domain